MEVERYGSNLLQMSLAGICPGLTDIIKPVRSYYVSVFPASRSQIQWRGKKNKKQTAINVIPGLLSSFHMLQVVT